MTWTRAAVNQPTHRHGASWIDVATAVALATLWLLRAAVSLGWPASGDSQVFLWLADLAVSGGVPYRDAFETKGPMAWMPLVPLVALAGPAAWVPRLVDLVMLLVGVLSARRVADRLGGPIAGALAMTLWTAWWCGGDWWNSAQPDAWAGAWIIAAWALAPSSAVARVVAGALIGGATMIKPFYAPFLVVPLLAVGAGTLAAGARAALPLVGGFALGISLPALWLAMLGGFEAWLACLSWTARVYRGGEGILPYLAPLVLDAMRPPAGIVVLPALAALPILLRVGRRPDAAALAIGTVGALAAVLVQRKLWPYHWLPLQPFFAIGFAVAVAALHTQSGSPLARDAARWMITAAIAVGLVAPAQLFRHAVEGWRSDYGRRAYEQREFGAYGRHQDGVLAIVDSLHRTGALHDRALVWGYYPGVETLLGRRPATRYAIMRPLFDGAGTSIRDTIRAKFLEELEADPPRWWLVAQPTMMERRQELDAWDTEGFGEVAQVLATRYRIAGRTRDWIVHERYHPDGGPTRH